MAKKPPKKPYNWKGASKVNWFPGLTPGTNLSVQDLTGFDPSKQYRWVADPSNPWAGGFQALGAQASAPNPYAGILGDYLAQARADAAAESGAQKGSMIDALRNYAISYGAAPDFSAMGGLGKDAQGYWKQAWDPRTQELARKAEEEGISSHARLSHQNDIEMRRIPAMLAARGMLQSGQTTADFGEQSQNYKNQGYDMLSELMSGITGSVQNFQEAERARQRQLADLEMQIAMQQAANWQDSDMGPGPEGPATQAQHPNPAVMALARSAFGGSRKYPLPKFNSPAYRNSWLRNRLRAGRM